jgi:hypothetical protein
MRQIRKGQVVIDFSIAAVTWPIPSPTILNMGRFSCIQVACNASGKFFFRYGFGLYSHPFSLLLLEKPIRSFEGCGTKTDTLKLNQDRAFVCHCDVERNHWNMEMGKHVTGKIEKPGWRHLGPRQQPAAAGPEIVRPVLSTNYVVTVPIYTKTLKSPFNPGKNS